MLMFERAESRDGVVPDLAEQPHTPNDVLELGQIAHRIATTSAMDFVGKPSPNASPAVLLDDITDDSPAVHSYADARYLHMKMMSPSSWDDAGSRHGNPARMEQEQPAGPAVLDSTTNLHHDHDATSTFPPSPVAETLERLVSDDLASFLVVSDDDSDGDRDAVDQIKAELSEESGGEMDQELDPGFAVKLEHHSDSYPTNPAPATPNPGPDVTQARSKRAGKAGKSKPKGGRKAAGVRAGTTTAKAKKLGAVLDAALPVVAFDTSGVLPKDHKPARGRGRHLQLQTMTKVQIEAESIARQEKNRLAARECRVRRKNHVHGLQDQVAALEKKERRAQSLIVKLRARLAVFEKAKKATMPPS